MIESINKVLKIIIIKSPKNFALMCVLLGIEFLIIALSVFSLIPLADYILDTELNNPSKFSNYILSFYKYFNIKINFLSLGAIFIVGQLLRGVITSLINFSILKIKYEFIKKINEEALSAILETKWNFFAKSNYGRMINTFTKEIDQVGTVIGHIARSFASFVQLLFFLSIPIYLNYKVSFIIILIFSSISFLIIKFGNPLSFKLGKINLETANRLVSNFVETLQAAKQIKIFGKELKFKKRHLSRFDYHVQATLKSQMLQQVFNAFFQPIGIIVIISVFGFFINSGILLSEIAAIFYSLISIVSLTNTIVGVQINISNFLPKYDQVDKIINEAIFLKEKFGNIKFNKLEKNIILKDVEFSYEKNKIVLNNLNFEIKKNNITAIVGDSGSGKSTIADLIVGIIIPQKGEIIVNGVNINNLDINLFRKKIGYVSQDIFLFNDTVRNNLTWSVDEEIKDDHLWQALRLSKAYDFVWELPLKLDTVVGERGVQLSGGQRQRLSLARTFIKKPEILILDEATSSLDSLTEMEIQKTIENIKKQKEITLIIIAHRLSTIRNADKILVLDGGKIAQQGNYDELSKNDLGKFKILLKSQQIK